MFLPGLLIPADLERIRSLVDENFIQWAENHLRASPGAIMVTADGQQIRIPTLVTAQSERGCVFFKEDRCSIHENAPFGCAFFSEHDTGANELSVLGHIEIMKDFRDNGPYSRIWYHLHSSGIITASPEVNRRRRALYLIERGLFQGF